MPVPQNSAMPQRKNATGIRKRTTLLSRPLFAVPAFVLLACGAAEFLLRFFHVPQYLVPLPSQVMRVLLTDSLLWQSLRITVFEWVLGTILAVALGFLLAVFSLCSKTFSAFCSPTLVVSQSIPYLVLAPLLMLWFGLGLAPKVVIVVLTCCFPIAVVLQNDLARAKEDFFFLVRTTQIQPLTAFFHIYLPAALPGFLNSLKISVSYSFSAAVLAELMGAEQGLGVYLLRAQTSYQTNKAFAAVAIVVGISLLATEGIFLLKRKLVFWQNERNTP